MKARELSKPKASSGASKVYQLRLWALRKERYPPSGPQLVPGAGGCARRARGACATGLVVVVSPAWISATRAV